MSQREKIDVFNTGILAGMDATAIAENIRNKKISAKEAADCVKTRAEEADPRLNAIVASDYDLYLDDYNREGMFAGVPTFIKDLVNVKGFPNRSGSSGMPDKAAKKHEKCVQHFLSAGFVTLGKSATSEFGLLPTSETRLNGATLNPHHTGYSTGGSSGGAGALVAAGIVPIAHAMDGGGSIRIPASCCGLVGLKPTRDRILGASSKGLPVHIVTDGVVTRTVRDTANFWAAMEQYNKLKKLPEIGRIKGPSDKRLKIAVFTQNPASIEAHPDVAKTILEAGKACEALGHHVEHIPNPYLDKVLIDFLVYYCMLGFLIQTFGKVAISGGYKASKAEPFTKGLSHYFKRFLWMAPGSIRRLNVKLRRQYDALLEQYDVVLSPNLLTPTPEIGYYNPERSFIDHLMRLLQYINFTIVQNATGAPAISLPMGACSNGLPIGAMFGAGMGNEKVLLELSFELEAAGHFRH